LTTALSGRAGTYERMKSGSKPKDLHLNLKCKYACRSHTHYQIRGIEKTQAQLNSISLALVPRLFYYPRRASILTCPILCQHMDFEGVKLLFGGCCTKWRGRDPNRRRSSFRVLAPI